ncbi:mitotic spindle assembly checkpoint protein MAD2A-like isoform X2 [Sciurus carolinensis]|uniref:mitotic spindle assembly checkpoint protein MAD2A-like isoform X2 n=1 Tax=Sciurus carolinensis TaxID=30640 RepID=UPI001FB54873|nr:mitotic spindle assembly checkpoint protein MAD2A-like isoform X2 [Sciurus carolinensis]
MARQLSREQGVTLRESAEIVAEFFSFGINSILYQRGIYPSETFTRVQKYGLTLLVTTDPELIKYLSSVVEQLKGTSYEHSRPSCVSGDERALLRSDKLTTGWT